MSPYALPRRCTWPGCPRLAVKRGRCDEHRSSGWVERPRPGDRERGAMVRLGITEAQWLKLKAYVLERDGRICYRCGGPGATEVDHVRAVAAGGSKSDPENLAAIHEDCHHDKTVTELAAFRRRKRGLRY